MKQLNTGLSTGLPVTLQNSGRITRKQKAMAMFGFAFAVLSAGTVKAQTPFTYTDNFEVVTTSGSSANAGGASVTSGSAVAAGSTSWSSTGAFTTFTGTGAGSTATALSLSTSTATTQVWTLTIPVTGATAEIDSLAFDYRGTSTTYANMGISINGTAVYSNTISTSGSFVHLAVPHFAPITGAAPITVQFVLSGGTHGSGGTWRMDNVMIMGKTTTGGCTGTPSAAGTVSTTDAVTYCGTADAHLTLAGATAGSTYQWQDSVAGVSSSFSDISGETSATYHANNTATTSAVKTYYRVKVSCTGGSVFTAPLLITVNALPNAGSISGLSNPLIVGSTQALLNTSATGGNWGTANSAIATVDGSGNITGVKGGITTVIYSVLDGATLCSNQATATVNVAWPNTLALYAGSTGTDVTTINVPGDVTHPLVATGFGVASPCTSGGLSGLTVNVANTAFSTDSAHVSYMVYPAAHKVLNMARIHATTRESSTGPKKARIAYRYWSQNPSTGVHFASGWIAEANDVTQSTTGSCGTAANSWDFNTGVAAAPDPTVNGITDSLEVAVFPFNPGASTGTFQANTLEVYGIVTDSVACSLSPAPADSVLPSIVHICDSGSRFLNYNLGTGGVAGLGITYQWQSSSNPTSGYMDITGATGAGYQIPNQIATSTPTTTYYRVKVTCNGTTSTFSVPDTVTVAQSPANAGIITGAIPSDGFITVDHLIIGTPATTPLFSSVSGGTWSSNDTSVISIDKNTGVATPNLPGDAVITYTALVNGCAGRTKDTIVAYLPGTEALYVGTNGSLVTNAWGSSDVTVGASLASTGFTTGSTCSNGGVSGLINSASFDPSGAGPRITFSFDVTGFSGFNMTGINATLRTTLGASVAPQVYFGYSINSSAPVIEGGAAHSADADDCGYDVTLSSFNSLSPVALGSGDHVDVFVYGFGSTSTLQVNTIDITGDGAPLRPTSVANVTTEDVQLYPNPATNVLNVASSKAVNVVILSIDGKKLIDQQDAKSINVSGLANGMYMIQVYSNNNLIKTAKFTKQ